MSNNKKVLLLVGSPRCATSTSYSLGSYLLERLSEQGMQTDTIHIYPNLKSDDKTMRMVSAIDNAQLVVLAFPLYVDQLPAPVINALELIHRQRKQSNPQSTPGFLPIVNCGFPEAHQNDVAVRILQQFVQTSHFSWKGSLTLGMGEAISGKPLKEAGGMVRNVRKALDLTADALVLDQDVPQEAHQLMRKRFIPIWLYLFMGNRGWKSSAKKNGVGSQLSARPYEQILTK